MKIFRKKTIDRENLRDPKDQKDQLANNQEKALEIRQKIYMQESKNTKILKVNSNFLAILYSNTIPENRILVFALILMEIARL